MPRNVSPEKKIQAVKEYLKGYGSYETIAKKYGVSRTPFSKWVEKYRAYGKKAFIQTKHKKIYTEKFKQKLIDEYLLGNTSFPKLAKKYKIPSSDSVRAWVLKYNSHKKIKTCRLGGIVILEKGRTTTLEERIEIVEYCISHEHNYGETAEKYQISYQQARNYTKKYEEKGLEGLKDNRGRNKPENEMTEVEKLRAENKLLKAEKDKAEMEISFLKKLAEIERRRG